MDKRNQLIEKRAIVLGLAVNIVLFFFKLIAGVLGGSAALVADSVHTITDVTTDVAVLIGSRFWHSPADKNHTYGHGRIETAVAFGIGLILAFTSLQLIISASTNLISGSHGHTEFWTIWIAGLSICFKEGIFFYTLHASKVTKSMALKANAWHHRADSISTIPVIVAIYLTSIYPGLWWVDPVGVLLVAGLILKTSFDISKPAFEQLVDTGADEKIVKKIEEVVNTVPEIHSACDIKTRYVGAALLVDFSVRVDKEYSIAEGYDIIQKSKDMLTKKIPDLKDVTINLVPTK